MDLLEIVSRTIETHSLLKQRDSVLVALSGGPDSVALLHLLHRLQKKYHLTLFALYINHQIRKRAALREEQFCRELCCRLDIPLRIVREDIPHRAQREKKSIEESARDFRYETFERLAHELGCTKVALGHHADDRVETILFRIVRGTGRTGLLGMPISRGKIIRPLFKVSKEQILAYLKRHELSYCLDQSNLKSEYSRNFVRNKLIPQIKTRLNPQFERAVLNLSETLADEEEFLESIVSQAVKRTIRSTSGKKIELDTPTFSGYTVWLRRRLLRYCLGIGSGRATIDRETIDRLDRFVHSENAGMSLPGRVEAVRAGEKIVFRFGQRPHYQIELRPGERVILENPALTIRCRMGRPGARVAKKTRSSKVFLDWAAVTPPMVVRPIRPGDRFQPLGLRGTKKVGDYLTDRKVPRIYRDEIPVVEDRHGIIWLVGYEIAEWVKVKPTTRKVVELEVSIAKGHDAEAV